MERGDSSRTKVDQQKPDSEVLQIGDSSIIELDRVRPAKGKSAIVPWSLVILSWAAIAAAIALYVWPLKQQSEALSQNMSEKEAALQKVTASLAALQSEQKSLMADREK